MYVIIFIAMDWYASFSAQISGIFTKLHREPDKTSINPLEKNSK